MTPRPVLVEWIDSADIGAATWLSLDGLDDDDASPCEVVTVGWLVSESESAVVLTLSISSENDARGAFVIPTACITRMVSLRPVKQPAPESTNSTLTADT